MQTALFFDLDHTLIRPKSGETFPKDLDDWEFLPSVLETLAFVLGQRLSPIVIVTNQAGVVAGYQTIPELETKLATIKAQMLEYLQAELGNNSPVEIHHYCAFAYDYDRKPAPGMAYRAALDLHLDLQNSLMIGDMDTDEEFAHRAGMNFQHINNMLIDVAKFKADGGHLV